MKKTLSILLLSGSMALVSCDKELLTPYYPGALTEEVAIQNSADLQKLMNTAYGLMTPGSEIEFNSVFTDEVGIGYANGGQGLDDNFAFLLNSGSGSAAGIWSTHYSTLAIVNRVIIFADRVQAVDAADQVVIDKLKAEALTIRAHAHIQLISYFSENPKDRNKLGVMLANRVFAPGEFVGRSTNGELYDFIDADLVEAESLFVSSAATFNPIFASNNFVGALKARVSLLRGDYTNALLHANNVIANSGMTLAKTTEYKSVFHTDTNPSSVEVIFKLKKLVKQTKIGGIWASVSTSAISGSPFYEMGRSVFNLLNTTYAASVANQLITDIQSGKNIVIPNHGLKLQDIFMPTVTTNNLVAGRCYFVASVIDANTITLTRGVGGAAVTGLTSATGLSIPVKTAYGDIRYSINVDATSVIDLNYASSADFRNTDKITIGKYPGTSSNGLMVNDIKICRLSEMYFIKAEALAAQGQLSDAADAIQTIRNNRYSSSQPIVNYANVVEAYQDILKEKRLEFAYEGYRFLDLKRLGALANVSIDRDPKDCEINQACNLPMSDHRFTLPIPTIETNSNSIIKGQQNTGY